VKKCSSTLKEQSGNLQT